MNTSVNPPARTASVTVPPPAPLLPMVAAICASELRSFGRERLLLVLTVLLPVGLLLLFAQMPGMLDPDPELGGLRAVDVVMAPIAMGIALMVISLQMVPQALATARDRRYLRRISTTPAPRSAVLLAHMLVGALNSVAACAVVLLVGLLLHDLRMPVSWGWFLLCLALSLLALLSVSVLIGGLAPNATWANGVGAVFLMPTMFFSGVFVPAESMPGALQPVTDLLPTGAALHTLRDAWQGQAPEPLHVLVLVATAVLLWPLAIRFFRWS